MTINELRKKTGLSQSNFAKEYHLSLSTLKSWEQGIYDTPERFIYLISRIIELETELNSYKEVNNAKE